MNKNFTGFPAKITLKKIAFPNVFFGNNDIDIWLNSGLTTLLGPNGSGKTKTMKVLRDQLRSEYGENYVRFVSAGRMGVLETFRSNVAGTGENDANDPYIGHQSNRQYRKKSETVIGDFMALESRSDLRLKVESRLQGLFGRSLNLSWGQSGLKIEFKSIETGSSLYGAGNEASGLTQLAAMLAAIYDDEIKFLLIDEPEVSLHPQLQSFVLKEILATVGDPSIQGKKCVIISTHSPSMLRLKKIDDLPSLIFFKDTKEIPTQLNTSNPILTDSGLGSIVLRLSENYKIAFFANTILLSEGVSDEVLVNTIADIKNANFSSTGVQVVPVSGKSELVISQRLFALLGKKTVILADLDVLDDKILICHNDTLGYSNSEILPLGYASLEALYDNMIIELNNLIQNNLLDVLPRISKLNYYKSGGGQEIKRSILTFLASGTNSDIQALNNSTLWELLRTKIDLLLRQLNENNVFLIRKGSIEDCYLNKTIPTSSKKPQASLLEAEYLIDNLPTNLDQSYLDIINAINAAKQSQAVIEEEMLREKIGGILGIIEANFEEGITDDQIAAKVQNYDKDLATIFQIKKQLVGVETVLEIALISPLFPAYNAILRHKIGEPIKDLKTKFKSL